MYTNINGLTYDEIRYNAPSVMGTRRHPSKTTERYLFLDSMKVVDSLGEHRFVPVSVGQSRAALANRDYTSHVVRFRHEDYLGSDEAEVIELVLRGNHMGEKALTLKLGLFVTVCENGLTVGRTLQSFKLKHIGTLKQEAVEAMQRLMDLSGRLTGIVEDMKDKQLTYQKQVSLANEALLLRYPKGSPYFTGELLNVPQLTADEGNSVWNAYQRVQYALTHGGIRVRGGDNRWHPMRRLTSVTSDAALNDGLFDLYESALHA
jgi:uncharacterized protein DUF932